MNERERLLQAILDDAENDTPRLVYADWLEEHGEAAHAELIRVQCSLAAPAKRGAKPGREELRRREKELLGLPELNPLGKRSDWKYTRGFVEGVFISDDGFDATPPGEPDRGDDLNLPLDKVLSLTLSFGQGAKPDEEYMARVARSPWLSRMTHLQFFESYFRPAPLRALAASAQLTRLREIDVTDSCVSAEALPDLALAPAIRRLRALSIRGTFTEGEAGEEIQSPDHRLVNEAFVRIAASPRAAGLEQLVIDARGLGEAGARAKGPPRFMAKKPRGAGAEAAATCG